MRAIVPLFLILCSMMSCSVDYDIEHFTPTEQDCIIVNSYLMPGKPIQIQLYELKRSNGGYIINELEDSYIVLKENNDILFEGSWKASVFTTNRFPQVGATYDIEISHPKLPTVKAHTSIPEPIECAPSFSGAKEFDSSKYLFTLEAFKFSQRNQSSLWVTLHQLFTDPAKVVQYNEIYTNNVLVDKVNSVAGMDVKNESVGSVYYTGFLRIKNKNISQIDKIVFTPNYVIDGSKPNLHLTPAKIRINLITASIEYDKYNKSLYEQKYMKIYDEDISSVFYKPVSVFSNIENGFGIFAGINVINYIFELPVNEN